MKNHYETLGINHNATQDEIKKSYRKLALDYHPDRNGDFSSTQKFAEIQQAYQTLSNVQKRKIYDKLWNIHLKENEENRTEQEIIFAKPNFSWNILFAAVVVIIATILAIRNLK